MNVIISAIVVTSVVLLIYVLLARSSRGTNSAALRGEAHHRLKDKDRRRVDESSLTSMEGNSWLTLQPESDSKPNENVTPSLTDTANRSRCPACGAPITAYDERCPSCEIAFVSDGSQKWTLGSVGPADGICLPPTEVSE